jgi:hypothetical protein
MGVPNSVDLSDLANSQQSLEETKELPKVEVEIQVKEGLKAVVSTEISGK